MTTKSKQIKQAEKNTILKMLMDCSTDSDIMSTLGIPRTTFYRYKGQIYKDYTAVFEEKRIENIAFFAEQLHDRLTEDLKVLKTKLADSHGRDAAALAEVKMELEKTIFDLQVQGVELLDRIKSIDNKVRSKYEVKGDSKYDNSDSRYISKITQTS